MLKKDMVRISVPTNTTNALLFPFPTKLKPLHTTKAIVPGISGVARQVIGSVGARQIICHIPQLTPPSKMGDK
jgi:hypothetical protein